MYERDVFTILEWDKQFGSLRERLASGEKVFEDLVQTYFLNNNHRIDVVFSPDETLAAKEDAEMKAMLQGSLGTVLS